MRRTFLTFLFFAGVLLPGFGQDDVSPAQIEHLHQEAGKGYPIAQYNLGILYYKGEGVAQNFQTGGDLFHKAALQNEPRSAYMLAVMFQRGEGVEKNPTVAQEWLKYSANLGFKDAQDALQQNEGTTRVSLDLDRSVHQTAHQKNDRILAGPPPATRAPRPSFGSWGMLVGLKNAGSEVESGYYAEAEYMFNTNNIFSWGAGIGVSFFDNKVNTLSKGDVFMMPILIKTRIATPGRTFSAFVELGSGYFFFYHQIDPSLNSALAFFGLTLDEEVKNTFGYTLGVGIRFSTGQTSKLGLGFHKLFAKPQADFTLSGFGESFSLSEKVDLGTSVFGVTYFNRF